MSVLVSILCLNLDGAVVYAVKQMRALAFAKSFVREEFAIKPVPSSSWNLFAAAKQTYLPDSKMFLFFLIIL